MDKIDLWGAYKKWSRVVSASLSVSTDAVHKKRASRIYSCCDSVSAVALSDSFIKVDSISQRCRDRLCPLCEWRLSLRRAADFTKVLVKLGALDKYDLLMCCLTVKNCSGSDLRDKFVELNSGFVKLMRKPFGADILGSARSLEVTYNFSSDSFHPHLHAIFLVDKGYCIDRALLQSSWRYVMQLDYDPVIYLDFVDGYKNAAYEVGKSAVSSSASDVYFSAAAYYVSGCKGFDLSEFDIRFAYMRDSYVVQVLADSLRRRRLIEFRGLMRMAIAELKLGSDVDDDICEQQEFINLVDFGLFPMALYAWDAVSKMYRLSELRRAGENFFINVDDGVIC